MENRLDLAPSDSHRFGPLRKHPAGKEFATDADVEQAFAAGPLTFNTDFFCTAIKGFWRGTGVGGVKCLNVGDNYTGLMLSSATRVLFLLCRQKKVLGIYVCYLIF